MMNYMYTETSCAFPVDYCPALWSLPDLLNLVVYEMESCI